MDAKKISFGFSKVAKKPNILPIKAPKEESKVELIKCLEGKEIKLVAEKQEIAPLVIQLASNQKTSTALASLMKRRAVLLGEDDPDPEEITAEPQSIAEVTSNNDSTNLELRAARELLAAAQDNGNEIVDGEKLVLPALKADELPLDGAKESTIDDYDSIPIQQFGLAMLRGMGWVDPPPVSKKKGTAPVDDAPFMRPKGMGLGADKALKAKTLLVQPEKNEVLEIKKQAYVRILGGKQKDQYGQIEGFDDHAGRVIVKMAIGGTKEAFNEFLCQPVSRKEYSQYGKCINTAKYEQFKKHENEHGQIIIKREKSEERKSTRTERRESQREDERKSHRTKDEDRKPYKNEQRSIKLEERRPESRSYAEERNSYKHEERKPYKTEDRRDNSSTSRYHDRRQESRSNSCTSKSSSRRRQQSTSDEADDTGESTESDSDSAYERKDKKKSKNPSRSSSKSKKKSKKSKSKSHRHRRSSGSEDSDCSADERSRRRHPSKHKKKTKKSKHARSRTRSRSREGRAR
ncbi:G-patch domain and KOW motifs-containing protein [Drosophila innubila]|uniref:G-patch domain and KOW motifs-containing protein n=1 Tax=Drosophila innubila TaxID=198719 RepID=UPI00148C4C00|nr:G-patch domain and KOW motifs-containing protein [Drosophila innubila]